jgi:hypothetical protein
MGQSSEEHGLQQEDKEQRGTHKEHKDTEEATASLDSSVEQDLEKSGYKYSSQ